MNHIQRNIALSAEFHNLAQQTMADAFENAARVVHVNIIYHRPDSPALVQEFTWGTEDMLIPAKKLADMVVSTKNAFERANGAWGIEQALRDMEDMIAAVRRDIEAAKDLPREFSMSFSDKPHWEHAIMIDDVPFVRMQKLLRHWQQNLSNPNDKKGALNYVTFTQEPKTDHQPLRMVKPQSRVFN
jgi:uncharacterized protein Usg